MTERRCLDGTSCDDCPPGAACAWEATNAGFVSARHRLDESKCTCDVPERYPTTTGLHAPGCDIWNHPTLDGVSEPGWIARCPDRGTCHHRCSEPTRGCWRVHHCGPLSGVFTNNQWPASLRVDTETERKDADMAKLDPMKITIDLETVFGTEGESVGRSFQDAIVERAAEKLIASMDGDVRKAILRRVEHTNVIVDAEIAAVVREALAKPIQRTTRWGETQGEPTTVLEIAREALEAYFTAPSNRGGYGNDNKPPANLTELIHQVIKDAINNEFREAIQEARKVVDEKVRTVLTKQIGDALTRTR